MCSRNTISRTTVFERSRLGFLIGPYGVPRFLAVSRDGRWALANYTVRWERDVVVLGNFR